MVAMKYVALILGSVWFFPVSCTGSLIAGMQITEVLDARDIARGDEVHPISLVAEPGPDGKAFQVIPLHELPRVREKGEPRFLMSRPADRIDVNSYTFVSYRVVQDLGTEQVIEVEDQNDDRTIWGTYRASRTDVMVLTSRMNYFGYMFSTFPFAVGAALALYGIGRFLRRRFWNAKEAPVGS